MDVKYRKRADAKWGFIISLKPDQGLLQVSNVIEIKFFVNKAAQRDFILEK